MSNEHVTFSVDGTAFDLTLTFAGSATAGFVTAISGNVGGVSITGLSSFEGADNVFSTGYPYVDYDGLSFTAGADYNLFFNNNNDVVVGGAFNNDVVNDLTVAACFAKGVLIATQGGEVAVEQLQIGDFLLTASGAFRPIKWIGKRSYSERFARNNPDLRPICFNAGSLRESTPVRDLWVSPKHAMFLDGCLIPAALLVNDVTIVQPPVSADVHYFHIELETHDVLIADGAPSESFLDDGSRGMFQNAQTFAELYPAENAERGGYFAPRIEDGYALEAVQRRLAARAGLSEPEPARLAAARG